MKAPLLVELLTEELPPKSLKLLSEAFKDRLLDELVKRQLHLRDFPGAKTFATPRRLAVLIPNVEAVGQDRETQVDGPSASAPPQAIAGFARKHGVAPESLSRKKTPKGEVLVARVKVKGVVLDEILAALVADSLKALPIPKVMRWGSGDAQFVRPVHGLVMMHGSKLVPGAVLGVSATTTTHGHRFLALGPIALSSADEYEERLRADGRVIADFAVRRAAIEDLLVREAASQNAKLGDYGDLLDEVTALVEWPAVYVGTFDAAYLGVPQECLILTMRQNQKYFPLFDASGKLLARFLIVSNMKIADPRHIIGGNERVVRPRLEDARFFYDQDRRLRLESRVPQLAKVVYHNKLGSQLERVERLQLLAGNIARKVGANVALAERAAWLSKADLVTGMVGEFPELQGVMGSYYAHHDQEAPEVCEALRDQYRARSDNPFDPSNLVSASLYLADRIDALVGLFGIGEAPTGEKDPFALRRAALGIIHAFELLGATKALLGQSAPDVVDFLSYASTLFPSGKLAVNVVEEVHAFILERYWNNLATLFPKQVVEAVISQRPRLVEVNARVSAVQDFLALPQAASLAAANKRIRNILRKSDQTKEGLAVELLQLPEERTLFESVRDLEPKLRIFMEAGQFSKALQATATIEPCVNAFFDKVMVNADDPKIRANRHALLKKLDPLMNQVADISKLAIEK